MDSNGQMQLVDFRTELINRGFDGFLPADLNTLINRGYFYVAHKVPWYWGMANYSVAVPTTGQIQVNDVGNVLGFKSMEAIYYKRTAASYERLYPLTEQEFRDTHLPGYHEGVKGEPSVYYIDGQTLWVLPAPSSAGTKTIELRYNKRPAALIADTDVPVTPVDYDEIILTAALVRAHKRANEINLAMAAQQDLDESFGDALDLESTRMQDQQERVTPDDSWL
ncbi:MAG: hypothetical protein EHM23_25400 [Acidobacteria bacterium]|jgi:hypothetical protein|nr:MAG: hypothetical protein EHM23_25400 [Acidobacteriota bacterium]